MTGGKRGAVLKDTDEFIRLPPDETVTVVTSDAKERRCHYSTEYNTVYVEGQPVYKINNAKANLLPAKKVFYENKPREKPTEFLARVFNIQQKNLIEGVAKDIETLKTEQEVLNTYDQFRTGDAESSVWEAGKDGNNPFEEMDHSARETMYYNQKNKIRNIAESIEQKKLMLDNEATKLTIYYENSVKRALAFPKEKIQIKHKTEEMLGYAVDLEGYTTSEEVKEALLNKFPPALKTTNIEKILNPTTTTTPTSTNNVADLSLRNFHTELSNSIKFVLMPEKTEVSVVTTDGNTKRCYYDPDKKTVYVIITGSI